VDASSKVIPCFLIFNRAFLRFHSNRKVTVQSFILPNGNAFYIFYIPSINTTNKNFSCFKIGGLTNPQSEICNSQCCPIPAVYPPPCFCHRYGGGIWAQRA
jgi:hypothetical protein